MQHAASSIVGGLLFFSAVHTALACAIVRTEDRPRLHQESIDRARKAALALKDEADLVFTGTLSQLRFQQESVRNAEGRELLLQKHQAVFEHVEPIKGSYAKGQVLAYTINKNLVTIRCDSPFRDNFPRENGATERYLVYARDGKILRTNHIPHQPQALSGGEEALVLRGLR